MNPCAVRLPGLLARLAAAIAALLLVVGCETPAGIGAPPAPVTAGANADVRSLVGRVEVFKDGKPLKVGLFSELGSVAFVAAPRGSSQGELLRVASDGTIAWRLAPGDHDIVALRLEAGGGTSTYQFDIGLRVAADRPVTDLGTLRIDQGRGAVAVTRTASPGAESDGEPAIVIRTMKLGSYTRLAPICAPRWALQCTRNFTGVSVVEPRIEFGLAGAGVPKASSVTPKLAWQPSSAEGVRYDLVVWRAVSYLPAALFNPIAAPGPVAFYVEGLTEAEFTAMPALQPKARYFWSVRLRQGDTVSTWSTSGHFTFLLVAMSSSSGGYFAFETP